MIAQIRRHHRYLRRSRRGRLALFVVWLGLTFMTGGFAGYLPLLLERNAIFNAALTR